MVISGDFSNLGRAIFDPFSTHAGPSGTPIRDPFAANKIPSNRLDPAAIRLMQLLPPPTPIAATRNFIFNPTLAQPTAQFEPRWAQNLVASDRLFVKIRMANPHKTAPGLP